MYLILHNIRSVHNVGSIFRTADAAGVRKIFCTGYTPTPKDRFGRKRDDFAKVALGAEEHMSWSSTENVHDVIDALQGRGVQVIAAETTDEARHYQSISTENDLALVFGNEVDGLPEAVLQAVDTTAAIPMHGHKSSLNVSVATGVMLFAFRGRER